MDYLSSDLAPNFQSLGLITLSFLILRLPFLLILSTDQPIPFVLFHFLHSASALLPPSVSALLPLSALVLPHLFIFLLPTTICGIPLPFSLQLLLLYLVVQQYRYYFLFLPESLFSS